MPSSFFNVIDEPPPSSSTSSCNGSPAIGRWPSSIGLGLVCFFSIWFGLGATRLWDRDEPRNARCAVEMLERNDWIVPMFNGELRSHKPILLYWLQMPSIAFFGETDFAARFGSALAASFTILALYRFGRKTIDPGFGFWSAAALATSLMFVVAARAATPDACLIATSTIGILCLALHRLDGRDRLTRVACLGFANLGLAVLAKGPVGLILPLTVIGLWSFAIEWQERSVANSVHGWVGLLKRSVDCGLASAGKMRIVQGLLIAVAVAAPWYIWVGLRTDGEWLYGFFVEHNLGRAVSAMEGHRGGWWFYPVASLVGLFPWSLLPIPIAVWTFRSLRNQVVSPIVQLGLIWFATYLVMFSFAQTKLPSYITPSYPGAALLIGGFLTSWRAERVRVSQKWLMIGASVFSIAGVGIGLGLTFASASAALPIERYHGLWAMGFIVVGMTWVLAIRLRTQRPLPGWVLAASLLFLAGLFGVAAPKLSEQREDLETVLGQSEGVDESGKRTPTCWCSVRTIEPSWVYYLRRTIAEYDLDSDIEEEDFAERNAASLESIFDLMKRANGRMVVNASEVEAWRDLLSAEAEIAVESATEFSAFLKKDEIAVLKPVLNRTAQTPTELRR